MKRTGDRILLWALGLSIAAHGVIALTVRTLPRVAAHAEQTPAPITLTFRPTPPPPTPPPPPPKTQPRQTQTATHPTHFTPPKIANAPGTAPVEPNPPGPAASSDPGPAIGPSDAPTGPPEPTPTPKPACATPYAAAKAVDVVSPTVPDDANQRDGKAEIKVTLTPTGTVAAVDVYQTTGDMQLDRAALRAARESSYAPEIRNCSPVGGTYLFTVDFTE